jgi:hypothetical protein
MFPLSLLVSKLKLPAISCFSIVDASNTQNFDETCNQRRQMTASGYSADESIARYYFER